MTDRVQRAREEIGRRRAFAQAATPGPWRVAVEIDGFRAGAPTVVMGPTSRVVTVGQTRPHHPEAEQNAAHIAANDPAFVLAVLDAAESVLDRHQVQLPEYGGHWCDACDLAAWPCHDLRAVLDLYAPEATQ